jgi:hypothetical protein
MDQESLDHLDYADAAESAERGEAWPQAAALWRRAADTCSESARRERYADHARRCDTEVAMDVELDSIAKRALRVPTLATRNADHLDFHEVGVGALRDALRLAYRAGRSARPG